METFLNITALATTAWAGLWLYVVIRWMWKNVPIRQRVHHE